LAAGVQKNCASAPPKEKARVSEPKKETDEDENARDTFPDRNMHYLKTHVNTKNRDL
jgi:hypothetical protein